MAKKHSAICRLCREEKDLRRSHVVPAFFRDDSAAMFPTGVHRVPQPFTQPIHAHTGKRFARKQHGYWERRQGLVESLLCCDCEQKFSAFEDYAKRFFYGSSDPIRLSLPLLPDPLFTADYRKIKLFQLSLLWRAAEAKGEFFSAVTLSTEHRERMRQMLVTENPGADHDYFCTMARLVASPAIQELQNRHRISIETGLFAPIANQFETWQSYTFVMGGIVWGFCVADSGVPNILRNSYIRENGQFWLLPMNADQFLINFSQKTVAAGNVTWTDVQQEIAARMG